MMSEQTGDEAPMLVEVQSISQMGQSIKPSSPDIPLDRVPITVITGTV